MNAKLLCIYACQFFTLFLFGYFFEKLYLENVLQYASLAAIVTAVKYAAFVAGTLLVGLSFYMSETVSSLLHSKPVSGDTDSETETFDETEKEIDDLKQKRNKLDQQIAQIERLIWKTGDDKKELLRESLKFVEAQRNLVFVRLSVFQYLKWEKAAFNEYRRLSNLDYGDPMNNVSVSKFRIEQIIKKGESLESEWIAIGKLDAKIKAEITPRIRKIKEICKVFIQELDEYARIRADYEADAEIVRTLKEVHQIESAAPLTLPENFTAAESMKLLRDIQFQPLDQEIMFEHLRIKSVQELVNTEK